MLPPLGLGAMLPVACRRCIHLIAELGLTSNQSAASRRDAPYSTASTTRSRNSKEHGFGIDPPSKTRINARQIQLSKPAGESRFNSAEIRSKIKRRKDYDRPRASPPTSPSCRSYSDGPQDRATRHPVISIT